MNDHRKDALKLATDENHATVHALIHLADTIANALQPATDLGATWTCGANGSHGPCVRGKDHDGCVHIDSYGGTSVTDGYNSGTNLTADVTTGLTNEQAKLLQYGQFVADVQAAGDDVQTVHIDGVTIARTADTTAGLTDEQQDAIRAVRRYVAELRAGKVNMAPENPMRTAKLVETVLVLAGAWRVR